MQETYQEPYPPPEAKKGISGWLIALIVVLALIVIGCFCVCLVVLLAGPAIGNTFSTIIEEILTATPMP
ncbi:MAG: hypothetical protein ACUVWZ_16230 [Anaerolineae bacterium]